MKILCPNCGETISVNGLGRPRLDIPLKNVCECLKERGSVKAAANELGCSPAYIFGVLKANGMKVKDITTRAIK